MWGRSIWRPVGPLTNEQDKLAQTGFLGAPRRRTASFLLEPEDAGCHWPWFFAVPAGRFSQIEFQSSYGPNCRICPRLTESSNALPPRLPGVVNRVRLGFPRRFFQGNGSPAGDLAASVVFRELKKRGARGVANFATPHQALFERKPRCG